MHQFPPHAANTPNGGYPGHPFASMLWRMTGTQQPPTARPPADGSEHDSTATDQLAERVRHATSGGPDEEPPFPDGPNGDEPPAGQGDG
jgi:hypothetical protein